jgi:hypothetical protein
MCTAPLLADGGQTSNQAVKPRGTASPMTHCPSFNPCLRLSPSKEEELGGDEEEPLEGTKARQLALLLCAVKSRAVINRQSAVSAYLQGYFQPTSWECLLIIQLTVGSACSYPNLLLQSVCLLQVQLQLPLLVCMHTCWQWRRAHARQGSAEPNTQQVVEWLYWSSRAVSLLPNS